MNFFSHICSLSFIFVKYMKDDLVKLRMYKLSRLFFPLITFKILLIAKLPSGKSVRLWSGRLGFDSESGQTNSFKIGNHSFLLDAQHQRTEWGTSRQVRLLLGKALAKFPHLRMVYIWPVALKRAR